MKESIKNFPNQFGYMPEVINEDELKEFDGVVIGGMGGSGLVAGILRALKPELEVSAHHEYGLPKYLEKGNNKLFIAVSHSGNTEETLSFFEEALEKGLNITAISTGGELIKLAEENDVPHIILPKNKLSPRLSLGIILRAVLKMIVDDELFDELEDLNETLNPSELEEDGKNIADFVRGGVPVIYSSRRNQAIAYNWKLKFNETGKIPAFYNTFPELNHTEMQGFGDETAEYIKFIFIKDDEDDKRIIKRMDVMQEIFEGRGFKIQIHELRGKTRAEKIFNSLSLADWTTTYTAIGNGQDPEATEIIEEFKKKIA